MKKLRVVKIELSSVKSFNKFVELIGNERAAIATLCHYLASSTNHVDAVSVLLNDGSWHDISIKNPARNGEKTDTVKPYTDSIAKLMLDVCSYYSGTYDTKVTI